MRWSHLDLATGALRLAASGKLDGKVRRLRPGRGRRGAGRDRGHTKRADGFDAFQDPATGEPRLVSGSSDVRVWNPAAGGAAIEAEPEGHSSKANL